MTRGMAWQDTLVRSTVLPRSQRFFAMSLPASHKREKAPVNERVEMLQGTTGKRDARGGSLRANHDKSNDFHLLQ